MEQTYTYDQLVQFLYHEMSAEEAVEMANYLDEDTETRAMFDSLLLAKTQLPKVRFQPSQASLNNILRYSTKTAFEALL